MPTNEELQNAIRESLAAPEEVQTESGRVKNQSVSQLIKAIDYLKKEQAQEQAGGNLRRVGLYKIRNRD